MNLRDLMPFGKHSVPVTRGSSPLGALQTEVNRLFEDFFGASGNLSFFDRIPVVGQSSFQFSPAIDFKETDGEFEIVADVPGVDSKNLQVTTSDGYLTIRGEKQQETKEEKGGYIRQERYQGSFQRVLPLPETANLEKAEASFKDGVLKIAIPKKAEAQQKQRTLEIKTAA
jgi:HSP20 family protein